MVSTPLLQITPKTPPKHPKTSVIIFNQPLASFGITPLYVGVSPAAAWRNEARRVLRDRLADAAEQLNFDRALGAAAAAHLGGGAAGPPTDATSVPDPIMDDAPVQPTAEEAESAGPGAYCSPRHRVPFMRQMMVQSVSWERPGGYCSPSQGFPSEPRDKGSSAMDTMWRAMGLADSARHVIGGH